MIRLRSILTSKPLRWGAALGLAGWLGGILYGLVKPLPEGVSFAGSEEVAEVDFLVDLTYRRNGRTVSDQQIFERAFRIIEEAESFVLLDMFLFNSEHGGDRDYLPLAEQLSDLLIEKRRQSPELVITFITDEINNFYGAYTAPELQRLEAAGVEVVITELAELRDSNPTYSAVWRSVLRWFGTGGPGLVPHPLSSRGQKVTVRSYLKLLNFRANHRKVVVTEKECLITSANPHDASSFHSNIAFALRGPVCSEMAAGEQAVAAFSGFVGRIGGGGKPTVYGGNGAGETTAQLLTEGRIEARLLEALGSTRAGDRIEVAMFYLSDREVIEALLEASGRGVAVRLVLDPNKDAFGREKGGLPNRQVAYELRERSGGAVQVRWYDTQGEQFHTKLVLIHGPREVTVFGGSANLTRRNLGDYNLEADVCVVAPVTAPLSADVGNYFDRIWRNQDGHYTLDYEAYADESWRKRMWYRFQEWSGWSTF